MLKKLLKIRNGKEGFTLVELIVVIAILGILAAILIPNFTSTINTAKEQAVESNAVAIRNAILVVLAEDKDLNEGNVEEYVNFTGTLTLDEDTDGDFTYVEDPYTVTYSSADNTFTTTSS